MNFDRLIEISRALKGKSQTGRAFHTSFGLYKGKILGIGINQYNKTHPLTANYVNYRYNRENRYQAGIHSETNLVTKLGLDSWEDIDIVNIRIRNDGFIGNSCPCINCQGFINQFRPKHLFFSNDSGTFSELVDWN